MDLNYITYNSPYKLLYYIILIIIILINTKPRVDSNNFYVL